MKYKNTMALAVSALLLLVPRTSSAIVTFDWATVGDPGNAADSTGYGAVSSTFNISKYEVTNDQYQEFLNSKAASNSFNLYNASMNSDIRGGITQAGSSGSYSYGSKTDMGNKPVNYTSYYDAAQFVNWLQNGQGSGSTTSGAYTVSAGDITSKQLTGNLATLATGSPHTLSVGDIITVAGVDSTFNGSYIVTATTATTFSYAKTAADVAFTAASGSMIGASSAHAGDAQYWIPTENEWYKAAYYQPASQGGDADSYWLYPTQSNDVPTIALADSVGNISNPGDNVANYQSGAAWNAVVGNVTTVGSAGSTGDSFYGTFDQGGNVQEWAENTSSNGREVVRGGSWGNSNASALSASNRSAVTPSFESSTAGFRIAAIPEPSTMALLGLGGGMAVLWWKRKRDIFQ